VPADLRLVSLANLDDVIQVMNDSSHTVLLRFNLDRAQFLALSRFWDFSYNHSYIGYVGGEPAGIVLNSVDPDSREALSFYWGVMPAFRKRRLSMALAFRYLNQVRAEGYLRAHADAGADSPTAVYEKLGYRATQVLTQMESGAPQLPQQSSGCEIRHLEIEELLASREPFLSDPLYWAQRPRFLRHAAKMLEALGAYRAGSLVAYAVLTAWPGHTMFVEFQTTADDEAAGLDLLRYMTRERYPAPLILSFIRWPSPMYALLRKADFEETKRITSMTLEL